MKHASGVDPRSYSFDACWESFCQRGAERWIWLFCALAAFPGIPPKAVKVATLGLPDLFLIVLIFQYFHDQLLAFIEAHGDFPSYKLKAVVLGF